MNKTPFRRAQALFSALAALGACAIGTLAHAEAQAKVDGLGEYRSRGKGQGKYSGRGYGRPGTYFPPAKRNAPRERARRLRQIAAGILTASNGLMKEPRHA